MSLLHLSLQNVTGKRQPVVHDNDYRARLLRACLPSPKHNGYVWPHCKRYDPDPPSPEEVQAAYEAKYEA